jgi:hypothetical protein
MPPPAATLLMEPHERLGPLWEWYNRAIRSVAAVRKWSSSSVSFMSI